MKQISLKVIYVSLSILFLLLGITGILKARYRSRLPFSWVCRNGNITITEIDKDLNVNVRTDDIILKFENRSIADIMELDFFLDSKSSGEVISLTVSRKGTILDISIVLTAKWTISFLILNFILGLLIWGVGLLVYLKRAEEYSSKVFYYLSMIVSAAIMMIWHGYPYNQDLLSISMTAIYFVLYSLLPWNLLYFLCIYPEIKPILKKTSYLKYILLIPGFIVTCLLQISYFTAIQTESSEHIAGFYGVLTGFRIYLFVYLCLSIIGLINSYRSSWKLSSRRKIKWILWGLTLGLAPFLIFWTIPIALFHTPLIKEEVNFIFMMLIPISFAFSILRYQTFDIEIIINRSIVYFVITGVLLIIYLSLIGIASYLLRSVTPANISIIFAIISTLLIATFVSPVKMRIQNTVDRIFYRIKYDYKKAVTDFSYELFQIYNKTDLVEFLFSSIKNYIPIDKLALFRLVQGTGKLTCFSSSGDFDEQFCDLSLSEDEEISRVMFKTKKPVVKVGRTEVSDLAELNIRSDLEDHGIEIALPVFLDGKLNYVLFLGRKLSEGRYLEEDIELLNALTGESCVVLEKLDLLEKVIMERIEVDRLQKLNDLKSEFVSHVSHELRTPLTAISWSVENLLDGIPEKLSKQVNRYLEGIHESSEHLYRMIENLLDVSRIEANRVEVNPVILNVKEEIQSAWSLIEQFAASKNMKLRSDCNSELCCVYVNLLMLL